MLPLDWDTVLMLVAILRWLKFSRCHKYFREELVIVLRISTWQKIWKKKIPIQILIGKKKKKKDLKAYKEQGLKCNHRNRMKNHNIIIVSVKINVKLANLNNVLWHLSKKRETPTSKCSYSGGHKTNSCRAEASWSLLVLQVHSVQDDAPPTWCREASSVPKCSAESSAGRGSYRRFLRVSRGWFGGGGGRERGGGGVHCSTDLKLSLCLINTHELTIYKEHRQAFKESERQRERAASHEQSSFSSLV